MQHQSQLLPDLLHRVQSREISVEDALTQFAQLQADAQNADAQASATTHRVLESQFDNAQSDFEDLGFAKVDHARAARQGFPEVIFCLGKTPDQVAQIALRLRARGSSLLATRATPEMYESVRREIPEAAFDATSRLITFRTQEAPILHGTVAVLAAGTGDLPVAEEAVGTLEIMGARVERVYDVGVAGLHRLLHHVEALRTYDALIVCAGMEGALPSVVAGLVDVPVIAVPTSVGYGASFGGLAALLGMLNSCANGVAVVNIDNGFGAAAFAASILRTKN